MQFIAPDVVVLDPWQAVAADYREHTPLRADFSLPAPYQQTKATTSALENPGAVDEARPESAAGAAAAVAASQPGTQQEDAGAGRRLRKRPRPSSYQPNAREQEAAERHAVYAPTLQAAAAAVQAWLKVRAAGTLQAALGSGTASEQLPGLSGGTQAQQAQKVQQNGDHIDDEQQEEGQEQEGQREREGREQEGREQEGQQPSSSAAGGEPEPDYVTLYELRHAVKPKFAFEPALTQAKPEATHAEPKAAHAAVTGPHLWAQRCQNVQQGPCLQQSPGRQQQQQHQQQRQRQPCSLFNRLISNSSSREAWAQAAGHPVLLPPRCAFLMSDARHLQPLLSAAESHGGFQCILADPPWENKSVKRSGKYPTLPPNNLLGLPLRRLMHPAGCLVALWVTNRERLRRFIHTELLPAWGLRHVATWHWLKVADGGQPVSRLDVEHRRPYESVLLCWPEHLPDPAGLEAAAAGDGAGAGAAVGAGAGDGAAIVASAAANASGAFHLLHDRPLVLVAAPPSAHSRKPHLGPLLLPLLPPGARCLEMFARELHTGWTSWGNEALRFQSSRYLQPGTPTATAAAAAAAADEPPLCDDLNVYC